MGVPAFFRWLSRKYPSIVSDVIEEECQIVDGVRIPIDCTKPNLNFQEFDNLYLDMNGIIHPCAHPEDRPPPETEDDIFVLIFEYIDRLMAIIRPRKLLYMAIDGVAPRAKMNQQRSRRFRTAKESADKKKEIQEVKDKLMSQGIPVIQRKKETNWFDSNCITPGTPFMERLAKALRYYIALKIKTDPAWANILVILSDASVPGEGEHKIMDFIRKQRASSGHDPNTAHCLCGADADLIMLGLATHEANFTIIREEFIPRQMSPCELCNLVGHTLQECDGGIIESSIVKTVPVKRRTNFIFIRLPVLREYLEKELIMYEINFKFDLERAIDDWVFLCFLVGNDFLPHLPSLEIRENAICRLVRLYKQMASKCGGYLTDNGEVNMQRISMILAELGDVEDDIFKRRQENEQKFKDKKKSMKCRNTNYNKASSFIAPNVDGGLITPVPIENANLNNFRAETKIKAYMARVEQEDCLVAERRLLSILKPDKVAELPPLNPQVFQVVGPNGKTIGEESDSEPEDNVKFYEPGWKNRYYEEKFGASFSNVSEEFRRIVAEAYMEGLCWVLKYYYSGCPSWDWFYPYHYAPFASDFDKIEHYKPNFPRNTKPFNPLEQLMGVFPAASSQHVPECWRKLMTDIDSEISDFYPTDFAIDLNGKKFSWMGVALLPFVDQERLLACLEKYSDGLTEDEKKRNIRGENHIYVSKVHSAFEKIREIYETNQDVTWISLNPTSNNGVTLLISRMEDCINLDEPYYSPVKAMICKDFTNSCAMALVRDPFFVDQHHYPVHRLEGVIEPERIVSTFNGRRPYNNKKEYHQYNNRKEQHNVKKDYQQQSNNGKSYHKPTTKNEYFRTNNRKDVHDFRNSRDVHHNSNTNNQFSNNVVNGNFRNNGSGNNFNNRNPRVNHADNNSRAGNSQEKRYQPNKGTFQKRNFGLKPKQNFIHQPENQ
ncbi:5'-3' exoribonuclease 2 homolog [Strongyloides ratti]|uniref:5'-3' exoribonuclease n=1 Tax=Strongyloides ratti TaxID=34506 RepID=A0A090LFU1_STRRB|nr:5'-3' exoribonuclease 2 homolog [Strongyloides ratti]CEF68627.1 5'-3' exoribonuclease 2 homolog [Strongyloides ratti]